MKRVRLFSLVIALALLVAFVPSIAAYTNGSGGFTDDIVDRSRPYSFTLTPSDDDGDGNDWVCVVCYDTNGDVTDVDAFDFATGTDPVTADAFCSDIGSPFSPLDHTQVVLGDAYSPVPAAGENSLDGIAWCQTAVENVTEPEAELPAPGCDQFLAITDSAVVGSFVSTTNGYWAPGEMSPDVVIEAGKTAWVLGVDESGAYYKIIWACSTLWVPVETMGPNFDNVWNGTPLPTAVVE
jgi:hypothetical protein